MSDLPPSFFSDPARTLHVDPGDAAFTGPSRLAREAAAATAAGDRAAMADVLGRAWRSGAPPEVLDGTLTSYAMAEDLDEDDVRAIARTSRFMPTVPRAQRVDDVALLADVAVHVAEPLGQALASAQEDDEPCWCAACVAEAAALN
jgi:hypothetical protein